MKIIERFCFSWLAVLAISLTITTLSVTPVTGPEGLDIMFFDKIIHTISYFFLSLVSVNTLYKYKFKRARTISFLYAFALGGLIEVIQAYIPYRDFEGADLAVNALGGFVGCLIKLI
jgi:VanZ family protein